MIEFDVDMGYLLEAGELDCVILNDENGEHEPMEFVPKAGSGTCDRIAELENAYSLLQSQFDITRERWMKRGAYIAKQRERIEKLESLVRDMYECGKHECGESCPHYRDERQFCDFGHSGWLRERMDELGLTEVER